MPDTSEVASHVVELVILKEGQHGFEALSPLQQIVFVIADLDTTVAMEGLLGYYDCRAGQHAITAIDALNAVGAQESANIIQFANAQFPGSVPPLEQEERRRVLTSIDEAAAETIELLGNRFMEYPDDLGENFEAFVWANRNELTV